MFRRKAFDCVARMYRIESVHRSPLSRYRCLAFPRVASLFPMSMIDSEALQQRLFKRREHVLFVSAFIVAASRPHDVSASSKKKLKESETKICPGG